MRSSTSSCFALLLLLLVDGCAGRDQQRPDAVAAPSAAAPALTAPASGAAAVSLAPLPAEAFPDGPCGGFERGAKSGKTQSLLGGRISLRAVEGLEPLGRPHDIMAAPSAVEMETRLFLEQSGKKLVVFTEELFRRPGPDLAAAIRAKDKDAADAFVGTLPASGLTVIGVVPKHAQPDHEKALALRLYVVTPDDLVVRMGFFISPNVVPEGAGCSKLARGMAETLAVGARRIDLAGGARNLDGHLTIDIPPSTILAPQEGPDFVVYHLIPVAPFGESAGELNVYVGGHPQRPEEGNRVKGKLLGVPVDWIGQEADDGFHMREALVEIPWEKGLFTHVFFAAPDAAALAAFEKIAQSIRKSP